jgi:type II secretory pathway predicted ATPase ExeA
MLDQPFEHTNLPPEEKVALTERILVPHSRFNQALERIGRNHRLSARTAEPRCVAIVGETGAGKTTVASVYLSRYAVQTDGSADRVPVFYFKVPSNPRIKSMAQTMLIRLCDPLLEKRRTQPQLTRGLVELIRETRVELVLIDEFQHFVSQGHSKMPYDVADWLKEVIDDSHVPVVLLGLPECTHVFDVNPQLARRFSERYEITSFKWDDPKDRAEFRAVLRAIEKKLPFSKVHPMSDEEFAFRMHIGTGGRMGYLMNVVRSGAEIAAFSEGDELKLEHIVQGYERHAWRSEMFPVNPFSVSRDEIETEKKKLKQQALAAQAGAHNGKVDMRRLLKRR